MNIRRLAIPILVILTLTLAVIPAIAPNVRAAEGDLNIFDPASFQKDVNMEESVVYRWGIYNNGSNPHTVLIIISDGEYGWTAELSNEDSYFELDPDEFQSIELSVTAPNSRDYPDQSFTLTAHITDLVTSETWTYVMGSTLTTIEGGAYVPPTRILGLFDNLFPDPLDNEWGVFLLTVIVWLIIGTIIFFVLDPVVKYFTKRTETTLDDAILSIVKGPVFGLIVMYGVISSLSVLDLSWSIIHSLEVLYKLFFIVMAAWMAFKVFKDVLLIWGKKYAEKSETTLDDVMLPLFEKLGMIVVFGVAMIAILSLMGIDVTMLLAGMGILGLVIAFAAQDTLGNFISGIFLLTDRPFKVGDLVLMENGDYCRVEHIGMRSTKLYNTFDHDVIILPNSKIANEKVINLTEPDNKMKVKVTVGVAYGTDIDRAKNIMLEIANAHPEILQDEGRTPFARMVEFGDSALDLKLYTWVNHLDNQWRVASELREAILHRFEDEGIEIPFPQHVVHMGNTPETKEAVKETMQPRRID